MAGSVYWKGYLKLSLVTCAVRMVPAVSESERVSFHLLNAETGNRLRKQMVDADTGEVVEAEDIVKGYEVGKDEYVMLTGEELDEVALESTHTIDIGTFCDRDEVDTSYLDQPYFLMPDDNVAVEPFAVIREAMRASDQVGLGRLVVNRRERIMMLEPRGRGMIAWALHYAHEVRDAAEVFAKVPAGKAEQEVIGLTEDVIDAMLGSFEPSRFEDPHQAALLALIKAKQTSGAPKVVPARAEKTDGRAVISIVEQLKRSLEAERGSAKPAAAQSAPAKPAAKSAAKPAAAKAEVEPKPAAATSKPAAASGKPAAAEAKPAAASAAARAVAAKSAAARRAGKTKEAVEAAVEEGVTKGARSGKAAPARSAAKEPAAPKRAATAERQRRRA